MSSKSNKKSKDHNMKGSAPNNIYILQGSMSASLRDTRKKKQKQNKKAEGLNTPQRKGIHQQCW